MAKNDQPSLNIAPANVAFGPGASEYAKENGIATYTGLSDIKVGVNVILLPGFEGHAQWADVRELISQKGVDSALA